LLRLLGRYETVEMRFDRIEAAVSAGEVDCGVLIHEGRFTYADRGLVKLADLGETWEGRMRAPIPLGAIAIRRDLGVEVARRVDAEIRSSVEQALAHPEASAAFVAAHAQEMAPEVIRSHIALYVNDYTLELDPEAVEGLLDFGRSEGLFEASDRPVFAYTTPMSPQDGV
jgi:1,4-dihydroxy-6-naphthoate synthase